MAARHSARVLLVDPGSETSLDAALRRGGFALTRVTGESGALTRVTRGDIDAVVLHLGHPAHRAAPLCEALRAHGHAGALVVVQGGAHEVHVVDALDSGADDYLRRPYAGLELCARLRAILRRTVDRDHRASASGLWMDPGRRSVGREDRSARLSVREYEVLRLLHARRGALVTSRDLMAHVWGRADGSPKALRVTVGRLRSKVDDAGLGVEVVSVRGFGYRLEGVSTPSH